MATVQALTVRAGRRAEGWLLVIAVAIGVTARGLVDFNAGTGVGVGLAVYAGALSLVAIAAHTVVRIFTPSADPVLLPAVLGLNALGLALIHRIDLAYAAKGKHTDYATGQTLWALVGIALALTLVALLKDHRLLRRYTYTAGVAGLVLLMLPLMPGLGRSANGAKIWISVAGYTMQPGEFAKVFFVIFFAGYLVTNRETLALAGPSFMGLRFPRARDLGPILIVWVAALIVQVYQRDLGASLLFFGIFVAMLYVATERISWVIVGLGLFLAGAVAAGAVFGHVAARYDAWLHALDPDLIATVSYQVVQGLFGMASGGLFGTGLGDGSPGLIPYAESDFIVAALGEELGLTGFLAVLTLYVIIVQRAMRSAIGVRDGFGKLLATGLGFALALQVFVVVGGVTRVIPLTGITTPFLAQGGSSLIANWLVVGLLLRISDQARRSAGEVTP